MIERFGDPERGGFFTTSDDHEELIARRKEIGDHPIPSGNSAAALGLLRLAALTGERALRAPGRGRPRASSPRRPPSTREAFAHLLRALDFHLAPTREVALVGDDLGRARPRSSRVRATAPTWSSPAAPRAPSRPSCCSSARAVDGRPAAYVCENFACQAPVTDPAARSSLRRRKSGGALRRGLPRERREAPPPPTASENGRKCSIS